MPSHNSPVVKGKKYRQLKKDNLILTQRSCTLASELICAKQRIQNLENLLANKGAELTLLPENTDNSFEQHHNLQKHAKNWQNQIKNLEVRENELERQNINLTTTVNDYWQLITIFQPLLDQTQQDRDNYANFARIHFNKRKQLREELFITNQLNLWNLQELAQEWKKSLETQNNNLQQQHAQTQQANQNLQTQIDQLQQQLEQQRQVIIYLEDELAEEKGANYRSQRINRRRNQAPQWQDSEATLFGDENQAGTSSNNPKNYDNLLDGLENCYQLIENLGQKPNWKSRLWQKTRNLGLTALAAYGTGYYQGSNSNNQLQLNCQTLITPSIYPVFTNSTHSWQENPLLANTHCDLDSPNQLLTFQDSNFTPPPPHASNHLLNELERLRLRPNITQAEYERLKANQAPTNLSLDWEKQLAQIKDLEYRPTQEQLDQAVQQEKDKYKNYIAPTELETKVQQKVNENITKYKDLIDPTNTTKIIDIAKAQGYQFQQIDIDNAIKTNNQTWIDKGLINPFNPTELEQAQLVPKTKLDEAVKNKAKQKDKEWAEKGLINPHSETDLISVGLVKKTDLDVVKKERDNRPNITSTEWENDYSKRPNNETHTNLEKSLDELKAKNTQISTDLSTAEKKVKIAQDFGLTNWDNLKDQTGNETLTTLLARPTRKELEDYQKTATQTITKKDDKINKLQTDLANWTDTFIGETPEGVIQKLNQAKTDLDNKKDEAVKAQEIVKQELNTALTERDTALLGLENLNQQLDDAQQEIVRAQRENRKLTQKFNQQKDQQTETEQQFQEQSNFLKYLQTCLTSAGLGYLASPTPRTLTKKELRPLEEGLNNLIQQKKQAQQNQARAEVERDDYLAQLTNQQNLNQNLQGQINNHTCPTLAPHTCSLIHLSEPHICPVIQETNCSHSDTIKITQLNQELNLGLDNPSSQQIIIRLKELIHKPPTIKEVVYEDQEKLIQAQQTITKLEKELTEKLTPFGEDLEVIKQLDSTSLEELYPLDFDQDTKQQIQQITNYQQLVAVRQAFLEKQLTQKQTISANLQTTQQEKKQIVKQRNLGLATAGTVLTAGLVTTVFLGRKVKELKRLNYNYYTDYKQIKDELSELLIKMHKLTEKSS